MVAADSSTLIAYIGGEGGVDVDLFDKAVMSDRLTLPPVVLTEVLSEPGLPQEHRERILSIPLLEVTDGYWARASAVRKSLIGRRLRARLADTLIAQSCIDHDVPLITRDRDFRHFAKHCGLKLA
jgi:predicted nucleic acid-binding protein